jgi:hypothetical protein
MGLTIHFQTATTGDEARARECDWKQRAKVDP